MRRTILTAAAPACLLVGFTPIAATADVAGTPAPPASATATAAQLSDQVSISKSEAKADESSSDASASVISVGGKPVPAETPSGGSSSGGTESGEGENKGALIDTVDKSPVRVQVAPWKARATGQKNSKESKRTSSASAALATVEVPDHAKISLLTSDANAEHTSMQSTGKSTSDAADISIGDMRFVLLHSEVNSSAKGDTYLVGLNGQKIGTREQLGELCALDVSGVAAVSCLTATGGTSNGIASGEAEVLGVQSPLPFNPASAFATAGTAGSGTPSILQSVAAAVPITEAPRAAAAAPAPSAQLPRTGAAVGGLAASGLIGLLAGFAMRLLGRPRSKVQLPA